jgi:hypothetical protein
LRVAVATWIVGQAVVETQPAATVILSEAKYLASPVGFQILRFTQNDDYLSA